MDDVGGGHCKRRVIGSWGVVALRDMLRVVGGGRERALASRLEIGWKGWRQALGSNRLGEVAGKRGQTHQVGVIDEREVCARIE